MCKLDVLTYLLTKCLDIILVPAALDIFDHQASLADLCVSNHADLDHHARVLLRLGPVVAILAALPACTRWPVYAVPTVFSVWGVIGRL